jgi:hypothetical protein
VDQQSVASHFMAAIAHPPASNVETTGTMLSPKTPSISFTVEHWTNSAGHMKINIPENSSIHELLQLVKLKLHEELVWGDGVSGWHLMYNGRNLYNLTSLINDYNIHDGSRIYLLPGERMRDRVYLGGYSEREMCQAIQLSKRYARITQLELKIADVTAMEP